MKTLSIIATLLMICSAGFAKEYNVTAESIIIGDDETEVVEGKFLWNLKTKILKSPSEKGWTSDFIRSEINDADTPDDSTDDFAVFLDSITFEEGLILPDPAATGTMNIQSGPRSVKVLRHYLYTSIDDPADIDGRFALVDGVTYRAVDGEWLKN